MGQITLNREDAARLVANEAGDPGVRLIAAATIAFFDVRDFAGEADSRSLTIARKLLHMAACEIYDAFDALDDALEVEGS